MTIGQKIQQGGFGLFKRALSDRSKGYHSELGNTLSCSYINIDSHLLRFGYWSVLSTCVPSDLVMTLKITITTYVNVYCYSNLSTISWINLLLTMNSWYYVLIAYESTKGLGLCIATTITKPRKFT